MSVLKSIGKGLGVITHEAKKTYDTKKLERRIKNYHREETEQYIRLGQLLFKNRGVVDDNELEAIFNDLDIILGRMKQLDKQITNIRRRNEDEDVPGYLRLSRKESDLTITRTDEGITMIRLCPVCKAANSPDCEVCMHCQRPFS